MPRKKIKSSNPLISPLSRVETLSRTFLLDDKKVLNDTEQILRQDRSTREELNKDKGLTPLLAGRLNEKQKRKYFSSFVDQQSTLFYNRLTDFFDRHEIFLIGF